jgi:hypothetical protein
VGTVAGGVAIVTDIAVMGIVAATGTGAIIKEVAK